MTWSTVTSVLVGIGRATTSRLCVQLTVWSPVLIGGSWVTRFAQYKSFCLFEIPTSFIVTISSAKVAPVNAKPARISFLQKISRFLNIWMQRTSRLLNLWVSFPVRSQSIYIYNSLSEMTSQILLSSKIQRYFVLLFLVAKLLYKSKCPSVCPYVNHV